MKLGIFISGTGSNMTAILDNFKSGYFSEISEISFVVSDKKNALGLKTAESFGVPNFAISKKKEESRESYEQRIIEAIKPYNVDIIALAGFMKVLTPYFLNNFKGKILNIHPSLLPAFPGVDAQHQAYNYGVKISGCTVHFVDESLDGGPVILQKAVERLPQDHYEDFKARILKEEHKIFSEALEIVSTGRYKINGTYVNIR